MEKVRVYDIFVLEFSNGIEGVIRKVGGKSWGLLYLGVLL